MSFIFNQQLNSLMSLALNEAREAEKKNHVPVGAIIEINGLVIAKAHNDTFWHAEILCIQQALKSTLDLTKATIFVTVEPCAMCMHAIKLARISKVFFGAYNKNEPLSEPEVIGGIKELESKTLMQEFFQKKRKND